MSQWGGPVEKIYLLTPSGTNRKCAFLPSSYIFQGKSEDKNEILWYFNFSYGP